MALNTLWIVAICLAHLVGLGLLLYSLEQTIGCFGRLLEVTFRKKKNTDRPKIIETSKKAVKKSKRLEFRWEDVSCVSDGASPKTNA
jgi:hypothetical protein